MQKKVFKLYASCVPVLGAKRATICDLQRGKVYIIPQSFYYLLTDYADKNYEELSDLFANDKSILDKYFKFLLSNELGFWTHEPQNFPPIDFTFQEPEIIHTAILEIDQLEEEIFQKIIDSLIRLKCKFVELRAYHSCPTSKLEFLLNLTKDSPNRNLIIYTQFTTVEEISLLSKIISQHPRAGSTVIHSCPDDLKTDFLYNEKISFSQEAISSATHCGNISPDYFINDIRTFSESLHHNSCLNRKISVDNQGNIKNCPSLPDSYGNIKETTLENALAQKDFKKLWNIKKDDIDKCKDCEFRHICSDCRAYVENPKDIHSKPLKCGYDPYTTQWQDWTKNPLKQKAIEYYNLSSSSPTSPNKT